MYDQSPLCVFWLGPPAGVSVGCQRSNLGCQPSKSHKGALPTHSRQSISYRNNYMMDRTFRQTHSTLIIIISLLYLASRMITGHLWSTAIIPWFTETRLPFIAIQSTSSASRPKWQGNLDHLHFYFNNHSLKTHKMICLNIDDLPAGINLTFLNLFFIPVGPQCSPQSNAECILGKCNSQLSFLVLQEVTSTFFIPR